MINEEQILKVARCLARYEPSLHSLFSNYKFLGTEPDPFSINNVYLAFEGLPKEHPIKKQLSLDNVREGFLHLFSKNFHNRSQEEFYHFMNPF